MTTNKQYLWLLSAVGLLMWVLNLLTTPTLNDDVVYRCVFPAVKNSPDVMPLESVSDLLVSQVNHFVTVNGRLTAGLLSQLSLWLLPRELLATLNAVLFVLLLHGCALFAGRERRCEVVSLMFCILFVLVSGFQGAMLWNVGSVYYLWTGVIVVYLLHYLRSIAGQPLSLRHVLLSPVGFVAGATHEALTLPLSVSMVVYVALNRRRALRSAPLPYLCFFLLGTLMIFLSPNLRVRVDGDSLSLPMRLLHGAINMLMYVRVVWLLLALSAWLYWRDRPLLMCELKSKVYVWLSLVVSLGIVICCGTVGDRVPFCAELMALVLLCGLWTKAAGPVVRRRVVRCLWAAALLLWVPAVWYNLQNYQNYQTLCRQMYGDARRTLIATPTMEPTALSARYVFPCVGFGYNSVYQAFDAHDINNSCAALLCGKDSLVFLPQRMVERMGSDPLAYRRCELDRGNGLYVWQLPAGRQGVSSVTFCLNDEDMASLRFYQRWLVYPSDRFELDSFRYEVIHAFGRSYLVFTKPPTNIFRRIRKVVVV